MLTNLPHIVVARGRQARMKGRRKSWVGRDTVRWHNFGRFRVSSWPRSPLSFLLLLADQHSSRFVPVLSVTRAIIVNTSCRDIFCINSKIDSSRENHHSSRFIDSSIRYWIIYFLRYLRNEILDLCAFAIVKISNVEKYRFSKFSSLLLLENRSRFRIKFLKSCKRFLVSKIPSPRVNFAHARNELSIVLTMLIGETKRFEQRSICKLALRRKIYELLIELLTTTARFRGGQFLRIFKIFALK